MTDDLARLQPVIDFVKGEMERQQRAALDSDVDRVAARETLQAIPRRTLRRMLAARAVEDESFDRAFQNREEDPDSWNKALDAAAVVIAEELGDVPGPQRKDGPSVADMAKMSDQEWGQFIKTEVERLP